MLQVKMLHVALFTLLSVANAAVDPVWETFALADCNGGMSLFPSSPVSKPSFIN
jgi:hypothetical protein